MCFQTSVEVNAPEAGTITALLVADGEKVTAKQVRATFGVFFESKITPIDAIQTSTGRGRRIGGSATAKERGIEEEGGCSVTTTAATTTEAGTDSFC